MGGQAGERESERKEGIRTPGFTGFASLSSLPGVCLPCVSMWTDKH